MIKKFKYFNLFLKYCAKLRSKNKLYGVYFEKGLYCIEY